MKIRVKKMSPTAVLPTRGSSSAAGYDLYADVKEDTVIPPRGTVLIDTGLQCENSRFPRRISLGNGSHLHGVCDDDSLISKFPAQFFCYQQTG